ncbi:hypothetical protein MOF11_03840 [Bacillus haynesii]|uniref:hypothetical protein n=1 Tax=Bacillus haynesii TaxID=1925021 RepID=UPI00228303DF|nr:hypothetical protein [Bacillus haynesii]MCY9224191.1 hypothetical protein [Bacillus haynesii]
MTDNKDKIFQLSMVIFGAIAEHNAKIKMTNEISKRISSYIKEMKEEILQYILKHSLDEYRGKLDWYHEEYYQAILKNIEKVDNSESTQRKLNDLINKLGEVIRVIDKVFEDDIDFYTDYVHPVLVDAVTLQIAIYSELDKRCGDHTTQLLILKSQEYLLEKIYRFYKRKYEKSYNSHNRRYFDHPLSDILTYKEIVNNRKAIEYFRYLQLINLNSDFSFKETDDVPKYGGYIFERCSKYEVKTLEGKRILAVNNHNGQQDDPSIFKDVFGIPAESSCVFTVSCKSTISGRKIKLAIWELNVDEKVNVKTEEFLLDNEDMELKIEHKKIKHDTFLRFEVYWFDKLKDDILINKTNIHYTQDEQVNPEVKFSKNLPLPDYLGIQTRSTNKAVYFSLESNYPSSLYFAANDANKLFDSPSLFYNIPVFNAWNGLDISFEVLARTREDIEREIQLCVHELSGDGIRNSVWSPKYILNTRWQWFSLKCVRQHQTALRCEVYWNDDRETDIMIRDLKVKYHLK